MNDITGNLTFVTKHAEMAHRKVQLLVYVTTKVLKVFWCIA